MSTATKTAPSDTTIETFFEKKTASEVAGAMAFFSPGLVSYIDTTLGGQFDCYDVLAGVFAQYMPNGSPPARSYATGVVGNETSALRRVWGSRHHSGRRAHAQPATPSAPCRGADEDALTAALIARERGERAADTDPGALGGFLGTFITGLRAAAKTNLDEGV
jgi:hypothetical protein